MARTLRVVDKNEGSNSATIPSEALQRIVAQGLQIRRDQKELGEQLKEIIAAGEEETGVAKSEIRATISDRFRCEQHGNDVVMAKLVRRADLLRAVLKEFADTPLGAAAVGAAARPSPNIAPTSYVEEPPRPTRRRGRIPGSKNKPKVSANGQAANPTPPEAA